ncbi:MAG TPA: hypothetical protein DD426_06420, partial [Clostridiaceae bacterium]|nr:hypothetical protein [Clostridiaceae bacterium]
MEYPDKIPEYIRNVFRRHGINIEDIIISANADISIDEEYCDIWIALDDKKLAMLKGKDKKEKIKLFSGFKLKKNENMNKHEWMEQSFETFPLEDIESLKAENMVSTGVLTAKLHGEDKELCMFNRGNAKKIATFVKLFEKIKKDQKLTEEDLREDDDRVYCP